MKVSFTPKFHKGEIRSIYYERLLKKAARVGADADLVRRIETLVHFDRCESLVGAREVEADPAALPAGLCPVDAPESARVFVALCKYTARRGIFPASIFWVRPGRFPQKPRSAIDGYLPYRTRRVYPRASSIRTYEARRKAAGVNI